MLNDSVAVDFADGSKFSGTAVCAIRILCKSFQNTMPQEAKARNGILKGPFDGKRHRTLRTERGQACPREN